MTNSVYSKSLGTNTTIACFKKEISVKEIQQAHFDLSKLQAKMIKTIYFFKCKDSLKNFFNCSEFLVHRDVVGIRFSYLIDMIFSSMKAKT